MASGPIKQRMVHTISIKTLSSTSNYGDKTYGAAATAAAYIEKVDSLVQKGNEFFSVSHKIWTETAADKNSKIWLPGASTADDTLGYTVEAVKTYYTLTGAVDHYEIWLGVL